MRYVRNCFVAVLALGGLVACGLDHAATSEGSGPKILVNRDREGRAVQGYDVVAYFTENKAVEGSARHTSKWGGATWLFASAEHKAMFDAEPERYAPQFGGYCAYAASINRISPISPEFFEIQDGRLILQHNQRAFDLWHKDTAGNLVKADANWPGLVARNGAAEKLLVNLDREGIAVQGYDVVAYFTDGKPVSGKAEFESVFGGARYRFASREHREMFENDPARFAPQFGGYCAYAASIDKISPIDPEFWQIENGRLLLQHTQKAYDLFNRETTANLARADRNWPGLVASHGG